MASKKFYVNLDLNQNELQNAVLENIDASGVVSPVEGQIIFDETDKKLKYYNGTVWETAETRFEGALQYKAAISHNATAPVDPEKGDLYVFNSAGTATNFGGAVVQSGDFAIYNGSGWDIIQGNTVYATTSVEGVVELADNSETIAGTDASRVVTPAGLAAWESQTNKTVVRKRVYTSQSITSTPLILTHAIGNSEVQVQVFDSSTGAEIIVDIVKGTGTVTLTSNDTITATVIIVA